MKKNIIDRVFDKINYSIYALLGFMTFFLLGCPAVKQFFCFVDAFGVFSLNINMADMLGIPFANSGALIAAGVFNVFVLVLAITLFVVGIFMLLKKLEIFDWKLDSKIPNFDLVLKYILSVFALFAFLSWMCILIFASGNKWMGTQVGGGCASIFVFGVLATAAVWLMPLIEKACRKSQEKAKAKAKAPAKTAAPKAKASGTKSAESVEATKKVEAKKDETVKAETKKDETVKAEDIKAEVVSEEPKADTDTTATE